MGFVPISTGWNRHEWCCLRLARFREREQKEQGIEHGFGLLVAVVDPESLVTVPVTKLRIACPMLAQPVSRSALRQNTPMAPFNICR